MRWVLVRSESFDDEEEGILRVQDEPPVPEEPPEPAEEPSAPPVEEEVGKEGVWKEDYDELIEPDKSEEEEKAPRPKRKSHWVGLVTLLVIIVVLVLWTVLSPKVLPPHGTIYVDSPTYANLGNFTGVRSIWAGTTTWGVSVSGSNDTVVGAVAEFQVLITKVNESTGNFFFRGTAIVISNVSLYKEDGTYLAGIWFKSDSGYGKVATVRYSFPAVGTYDLYVTAKFTVYEVMRIGYIPLEIVNVEKVPLEEIEVLPVPV